MSIIDYYTASISESPTRRRSIMIFTLFLFLLLIFALINLPDKPKTTKKMTITKWDESPPTQVTKWDFLVNDMIQKKFYYWRLPSVQQFYKELAPIALSVSSETGIPTCSLMAIASLESGYNTGYIAIISGNILSLNASKTEAKLPPLNIPFQKKTPIIDKGRIKKKLAAGIELKIQNRPPSYKKDYRPNLIAGTSTQLDYFLHRPIERALAWEKNLYDFAKKRIRKDSPLISYKNGYKVAKKIRDKKDLSLLISQSVAIKFIKTIGGKKNSFNANSSWPNKVSTIIEKLGLEIFLINYLETYPEQKKSVKKNLSV